MNTRKAWIDLSEAEKYRLIAEERAQELERINQDLRDEILIRKKIEQDLQCERDFNNSIIQTAQVCLLVLDLNGNILQMNPFLENISGYKFHEVQNKNWFDIFLPISRQELTKQIFKEAIADNPTRGHINSIRARDGKERWLEWYDQVLKDNQGHIIGLLSIGQDVTERKKIEEKVVRNAVRAEVLANIASRINAQLDLDSVLASICEELVRAIPAMPTSLVLLL